MEGVTQLEGMEGEVEEVEGKQFNLSSNQL